jgi:hypothetical protein
VAPEIDTSFLDSPTSAERERKAAVGRALHYAHRIDELAEEFLGRPDGSPRARGPEAKRAAPLVAAAAAIAWANVARAIEIQARHNPPTASE